MGLGFLPSDLPTLVALGVVSLVVGMLLLSTITTWLRALLVRVTLHHFAYSALGSVGTMAFERIAPEQYEWVMDVLGSLVGLG